MMNVVDYDSDWIRSANEVCDDGSYDANGVIPSYQCLVCWFQQHCGHCQVPLEVVAKASPVSKESAESLPYRSQHC